jgi:RNA polymerase sigma-70 factor (ECF subfamily)
MLDRQRELELVRGTVGGDPQAAAELVRAMQGPLYSYLVRLSRSPHVAEDTTQEALYRAIKHIERFDSRWRFSTWVFTIARRLLSNAQQRKSPRVDSALVDEVAPIAPAWGVRGWPDERTEESREQQARQRMHIDRALGRLPESQQEVVVLFHQLDWSIAQISELTGLAEGTVKSQLHRARVTLRELLSSLRPEGVRRDRGGEVVVGGVEGVVGRSDAPVVNAGISSGLGAGGANVSRVVPSDGRASAVRRHRMSREDAP